MTTALTFIAVLARWLVVVLGVLVWLVAVPFIALASELTESRRIRRSRQVAAALPPRSVLQEL